jgi:hypothetical protein
MYAIGLRVSSQRRRDGNGHGRGGTPPGGSPPAARRGGDLVPFTNGRSMHMEIFRKLLLVLAVTAAGLTAAVTAQAQVTCHKINAKGEGAFTGPTTTESRIIGGGILHGTTTAEVVVTGIDPATGALAFDGTLVLTTEHGTLTLDVFDGLFDPLTGEFINDSAVADGTGKFAGASGALLFHGFANPDGTFIDDAIVGEICVDLP